MQYRLRSLVSGPSLISQITIWDFFISGECVYFAYFTTLLPPTPRGQSVNERKFKCWKNNLSRLVKEGLFFNLVLF